MQTYQPDDARITLGALEYLRSEQGLRLRAVVAELPAGGAHPDVKQIAALRKTYPAEAVHAALAMGAIQSRAVGARGKFPELHYLWAPPEALEQATHIDVGRYKAKRFFSLGARDVADLCAGIGGDALAFAEKMRVRAVEMSEVRARCLAYNAEEAKRSVEVRVEDAERAMGALPKEAWVHIDPARRSDGKRSGRFEDVIPGPAVLANVFAGGRRGAIKLSPAVDFATLPAGHLELISHQGAVVQALLWLGTEQSLTQRTATVLPRGGAAWTITGEVEWIDVAPAPVEEMLAGGPRYVLYEVDGAITRAGLAKALMQAHGLAALTGDGGYLIAGAEARPQVPAGVLTGFDIWGIVPMSRVTAALKALPAGTSPRGAVEVKARGHLPGIDTDSLQKQWSRLHAGATVLLFRQERQTLAAIGFRAPAESAAASPPEQ